MKDLELAFRVSDSSCRQGRYSRSFSSLATAAWLLVFGSSVASEFEVSAGYPFSAAVAIRKLPIGILEFSASLSTKSASIGLGTAFELGPVGRIAADADLSTLWAGGLRFSFNGQAALGPAALDLKSQFWSANLTNFDPVFAYENAVPDNENGYLIDLKGTYRINRTSFLRLTPQWSSNGFTVGIDWLEKMSEINFSAGLFTDFNYFGPSFTVSWLPNDLFFAISGQSFFGFGANGFNYGLSSSIDFNFFEDNLKIKLFGSYEPWRQQTNSFRFGFEGRYLFEESQLSAKFAANQSGFGIKISYLFSF